MAILRGWGGFSTPNLAGNALSGLGQVFDMYSSLQNGFNQSFKTIQDNNTAAANKAYYTALLNGNMSPTEALNSVPNSVNVSPEALAQGQALLSAKQAYDHAKADFDFKNKAANFNYAVNAAVSRGDYAEADNILRNGLPETVPWEYIHMPNLRETQLNNAARAKDIELGKTKLEYFKGSLNIKPFIHRLISERFPYEWYVNRDENGMKILRNLQMEYGISDAQLAAAMDEYYKQLNTEGSAAILAQTPSSSFNSADTVTIKQQKGSNVGVQANTPNATSTTTSSSLNLGSI